jgi:hypothetical protein
MAAGGTAMLVGGGVIGALGAIVKRTVEASSQMEIFRNQIRLMSKDAQVGDNLFMGLKDFAVKTPFTIPQVMAGAKNLMAFGFSSDRVLGELQKAGEWAATMQVPIDEAAMILGKIRTGGIAQAMRFLQVKGISYADVLAAGGPIDPKTMRTKKGADPEAFLAAVNEVINQKFAGQMKQYMTTVPGKASNIKDQMILMSASIGDQISQLIKKVEDNILAVFNPELIQPFAKAVGQGLNLVAEIVKAALTPVAQFVTWIMKLSKEHPNFVKFGVAAVFVGGALLFAGGAVMTLLGVLAMFKWAVLSLNLAAIGTTILSWLGPLAAVATAGVLLYTMFSHNFLGIASVVTYFYNRIKLFATGILELVTSISSGVGVLSQATYDSLSQSGMLGAVITLFMILYRLYSFMEGFWIAVKTGIGVVAAFGSTVLWLTAPVWGVVYLLLQWGHLLGWIGNKMSSSVWKAFGATLGVICVGLAVAKAATVAYSIAQVVATWVAGGWADSLAALAIKLAALTVTEKAATAAQWLLNVALTANPIGVVIMAIAILITALALVVVYHDKITNWFNNLPGWAKNAMFAIAPFAYMALFVMSHWDQLKDYFIMFGQWLKPWWNLLVDGLVLGVKSLLQPLITLLQAIPDTVLPAGMIAIKNLNVDQAWEAAKKNWANVNGGNGIVTNSLESLLAADARHRDPGFDPKDMQRVISMGIKDGMKDVKLSHETKLDGRVLARTVSGYRTAEEASGR